MTKGEFDKLFDKVVKETMPQSKEDIIASISQYAKDPSHITQNEIVAYVLVESVAYTNNVIYKLLSELLVTD